MQLKGNIPLDIISTNYSTNVGWKTIACSKTFTTSYTTVPAIRLTFAAGNPLIHFGTIFEQSINKNLGDAWQTINFWYGWEINTSGGIDNRTGNGAANMSPFNFGWNYNSGLDWSYWTIATRTLTFNAQSSGDAYITVNLKVSVFCDRWDLVTLATV